MIAVYYNHVRFRGWIQRVFTDVVTLYDDLSQYVISSHPHKFAFFSSVADDTLGPSHPRVFDGARHRVSTLASVSDRLFVIDSELHDYHIDLLDEFSAENITWILPGRVNLVRFQDRIILWTPFIERVGGFYAGPLSWLLTGLDTKHYPKRRMFDVLMGRNRPHRDFVRDCVHSSGLQDQFVMSYQDHIPWQRFINDGFIRDSYVMTGADAIEGHGTNHEIKIRHNDVPISCIIPLETYNDTAYTLVAETQPENSVSAPLVFLTEKVVKPLVAVRPFVIFSTQGILQLLHDIGFQTFHGVIDESYDQEPDDKRRWSMAWQQVMSLLHQDQQAVRRQVSKILRHNQRLALETDWQNYPVPAIRERVSQHGGEIKQCLRPS